VIDSGIDYTHPDLAPNYLGGYDFIAQTPDPMDEHGHGTHVAGTIAAALGNQTGSPSASEGVVGVAPDVRLLGYKVCHIDGTCDDFAIQSAVAQAIVDGASVINMSLGETAFSQSLNEAVQDAWAAGLVIVAGAGNDGVTDRFYPAAFDNVISVGAFDEDHRRASFSNYGDWVDISAPGNVIMSSYPMAACAGAAPQPGDAGCYNWNSGTSMATPHVAGAAALVWSRADVTTNAQVVDILLNSADARGVSATRLDSWTVHGGLNIHDALSFGLVVNQPPTAKAGSDRTLTDGDRSGAESVTLDGSGSSDQDGNIVSYRWTESGLTIATGASPIVSLSVGEHSLTLTVTDDDGATAADTVLITVFEAPPIADTVTIFRAAFNSRRGELAIEATSSASPNVLLTAYDASDPANPAMLGALSYNRRKGRYLATFSVDSAPSVVRIVSSGSGSATAAVTGK
jgi:subtilisin family serine protease